MLQVALLAAFCCIHLSSQLSPQEQFPDAYLSTVELIQKYGYQVETHHVTSPDGYVTTLHRLPPRGRLTRSTPVLLQHALLGSSADWVLIGPRDGLGYNLVDAGYDVWLGNNRGNSYSRKHVNLTTSNKKYWDFSMHEMGVNDMPAVIDYILSRALSTELYYIGHSLGASLFFIMTSEKPEYNSKVRAMIGLAPGAFLGNARSPIVVPWFKALAKLQEFIKIPREVMPRSRQMTNIGITLCRDGALSQYVCLHLMSLVGGFNDFSVNTTSLPVNLGHFPNGASQKTVAHIGQTVMSGRFSQFDYGRNMNLKKYGRATSPDYDLEAITAPVALYYGDNDLLVTPHDIARLFSALKNSRDRTMKKFYTYSHFDFLWGVNVKSVVYDYILSVIDTYTS